MAIKVIFFDIGDTLVAKKNWLPGANEILSQLRTNRIRIGLISNTGELTRDQLQELLPADFDFGDFEEGLVMLSSETGIEKPDLGIFSLAVHHAGVAPSETMFVGENAVETLNAQTAGMIALRVIDTKSDYTTLAKWVTPD